MERQSSCHYVSKKKIGSVGTLAVLFTVLHLTIGDIFASFLAFAPTGWAILQVPPSVSPL